jgi:glycosyltransferase involved in cell wall biosynthesis
MECTGKKESTNVSIIIPAYEASEFIDECIASINKQDFQFSYEILIGVDCCEATKAHTKSKKGMYKHTRLFYFTKNVGPYVIKNSLVDEAMYDNILFFDADDVMNNGTLLEFSKYINDFDYVHLKYSNFTSKATYKEVMHDAVIGIKKSVFNKLNGFQPWRCAADTEFTHRLKWNNLKSEVLPTLSYYRRLHDKNLTINKETGHGSYIRNRYAMLIKKSKRERLFKNPKTKIKQEYYVYN